MLAVASVEGTSTWQRSEEPTWLKGSNHNARGIHSDSKGSNDSNDYGMFQRFGVEVLGLDLSNNMVDIAMERAAAEKLPSVCINITFFLLI